MTKLRPGRSTNRGASPPKRPLLRCWTEPEATRGEQIQQRRFPENRVVVEPCCSHRFRSQDPLILGKLLSIGLQISAHEFLESNDVRRRAFQNGGVEQSTVFPGIHAIPTRNSSTDIESHDSKCHHKAPRLL